MEYFLLFCAFAAVTVAALIIVTKPTTGPVRENGEMRIESLIRTHTLENFFNGIISDIREAR